MTMGMQERLVRSLMKSPARFLIVLLAGIPAWPIAVHAQSRAQDLTCQNGSGEYSARFSTGTTVIVGPIRNGSFAERACSARLEWNNQSISVASDAGQVGINVLGADLGFGKPVAAFQIDKSGAGVNRTYRIYSLPKPPHLLYTLTGGDSYSAADTDLDGRIEVWTDDAAAVNSFERLPGTAFDFAPTVVLRIEKVISSTWVPNFPRTTTLRSPNFVPRRVNAIFPRSNKAMALCQSRHLNPVKNCID